MSARPILCTVTLSWSQLTDLADALCELDGLKSYLISTEKQRVGDLVDRCHEHLAMAAGNHASLLYPEPPEAA